MTTLYLILLALAALCFLANAYGRTFAPHNRPLNLVSLGLFLWVLVPFIETLKVFFKTH